MRRTFMLSLALLASLTGCSSTPPADDERLEPQMKLDETWESGRVITAVLRAKDREVVVSVSAVMLTNAGVLCRVVSVSDVFDKDKWRSGVIPGIQEVDIRRAGKVGSSGFGYTTTVYPRSPLTWGDVSTKDDLVLETESSEG